MLYSQAAMSSVMNSVCCALVCLFCVCLVAWTIIVTSATAEATEKGAEGEGDHKKAIRGSKTTSPHSGVVCAINSSLDIGQVTSVKCAGIDTL